MFEPLLSRGGLTLERLHTLILVGEAGSLIRAAKGDMTRQAQYSKQLGELEDYFGVKLTRRQGKNLDLTEPGRRLATISRETLQSLQDFDSECAQQPTNIVIAAGDSLLQWLVLPRLTELRRCLPKATIVLKDLRTAEIVEALRELRADLGIIRENAVEQPLSKSRLFDLNYALFVTRSAFRQCDVDDYRRVIEKMPLAIQSSGGEFNQTLQQAARKEKIGLNIALRCESAVQACRAVRTRLYAGILPSIAASDLDPADFIQLPLPPLKSYARKICLAWNPRLLRLRPAFEKILQEFTKQLAV